MCGRDSGLAAFDCGFGNEDRDSYYRHPDKPLIVALTGTDLYYDLKHSKLARESPELATRIVVLQPKALEDLPLSLHAKTRVIYQSVRPFSPISNLKSPDHTGFCGLDSLPICTQDLLQVALQMPDIIFHQIIESRRFSLRYGLPSDLMEVVSPMFLHTRFLTNRRWLFAAESIRCPMISREDHFPGSRHFALVLSEIASNSGVALSSASRNSAI